MNTLVLPDALAIVPKSPVQYYYYHNHSTISKQQIVLNYNTISFLLEGTKEVIFGDTSLGIDTSKFIIMKAGNCLMTEILSETNNYKSVLLFFDNNTLHNFKQKAQLITKSFKKQQSVFAFDTDAFVKRFITSLIDITQLNSEVQQHLLPVKFEEIMWYLIGKYGIEFIDSFTNENYNTDIQFKQIIEQNQLSKLSLKELAFLCNMSLSTFKRQFEKHYEASPSKWFQQKRLEHAHYLLDQKQQNASEVYLQVGYENLSSFIQAYKQKYGETPKQHVTK